MTMTQADIEDPEYLGRAKQPNLPSNIIKVQNKHLLPALARAAGIVGRSATIPILACVRMVSANGSLTIEANNLELAIKDSIPAECIEGMVICVPAATLLATTQRIGPNAEITFEIKNESVVVRATGVRLTMTTEDASNFPTFNEGHFQARFSMSAITLARMLNNTKPFMSSEETRYYLCGVHLFLSTQEGVRSLRAEATNGVELGIIRIPVPSGADDMPDVDIPASTVNELIKLLDIDGDIDIAASEAVMMFSIGGVTLLSKLISATYPDCDRVIPRSPVSFFNIRRGDLLRALALARVIDGDRTPNIRLDISEDRATIFAKSEKNEVVTEIDRDAFEYRGEPLAICFWNRSLTSIASLVRDRVEFGFLGPEMACVARDPDDDTATYVAMATRF